MRLPNCALLNGSKFVVLLYFSLKCSYLQLRYNEHGNSIVFATVNMQKDFSCGSFILLYDFVIEID